MSKLNLFDLSGRSAIITGGSKGLGLAMAQALADAGAKVALVSRQPAAEAAATLEGISVAADVTSEADMLAMAETVLKAFGRIDILINNAGINIRGSIDALSHAQFRQVQATNVDGAWLASKAVIPHMKANRHGRIINIASALGAVGMQDRSAYCASKGAIVQLTRALAVELAPWGITVNAILPGPFLTEMNEPVKDDPQFRQFIVGATLLGRWGEMHEIQGAAVYLASNSASFTTGVMLPVDGGWTSR